VREGLQSSAREWCGEKGLTWGFDEEGRQESAGTPARFFVHRELENPGSVARHPIGVKRSRRSPALR